MNVSSSLEQAIKEMKKQLRFDETHDEDPYLQEMEMHNLCMVSIVGCNKPLDNECKQKVIWYQNKLRKSNVWILGSSPLIKYSSILIKTSQST